MLHPDSGTVFQNIQIMNDEETEEGSCQEAEASKTTAPKRGKKRKGGANHVAPSNTLTRFLGQSGQSSSSTWEDVNRQCPVCGRKGFSSGALAFHVNKCLDGVDQVKSNTANVKDGADCKQQSEIEEISAQPTASTSRLPRALARDRAQGVRNAKNSAVIGQAQRTSASREPSSSGGNQHSPVSSCETGLAQCPLPAIATTAAG